MTRDPSLFNLCDYYLGDKRLERIGSLPAIESLKQTLTYNDLRQLADYWVAELRQRGVSEGDRVALLLYDSPLFISLFLATAAIGAISVPMNTSLSAEEMRFILTDSGARLVCCEEELQDKLRLIVGDSNQGPSLCAVNSKASLAESDIRIGKQATLRAATAAKTPAFMLYTSGSTGTPKGALHLHGSMPVTVRNYANTVLALNEDDRVFSSSRLFFAYGLGNSLSFPLAAGARVLLDPERPTAERIAQIFAAQKPTVFFGVPAIYNALLERSANGARLDCSSLRLCVSAGEALPANIFERWRREVGLEILDGIGSTEMLHIFISNRQGDAVAGSSGRVVEGYEARLLDDNGGEVHANELGNLWVRGESAMAGYWNRAELTQITIRDGHVKTGDVYRCDEAGYFYHVGRSDDCVKVKGLWVSPIEVESALAAHPSVAEAAVVSAIGAEGLATVRAFVVIRKPGNQKMIETELREYLRARLPRYKVPSEIVVIDEMPRTSTGKIQRYKLRTQDRPSISGGTDDR
jgi:benzoate-CoA ligase family protein